MRILVLSMLLSAWSLAAHSQTARLARLPGELTSLDSLMREALTNNPEIIAARARAASEQARVRQAGTLDDPQFTYMREDMPDFRWGEPGMEKLELMQMVRFPTKLSRESDMAEFRKGQEVQALAENVSDVLARLRVTYAELWLAQQSLKLNEETRALLRQLATVAGTRYSVGDAGMQDVLKISVEAAKAGNQRLEQRRQELTAKAMLMALVNRQEGDTIGTAILPDEPPRPAPLDSLEDLAMKLRPMVRKDSLGIEETRAQLALAKEEYLPDLKFGVQYVTSRPAEFQGWSVIAGITLPFAPWTLGKASGRTEEAEAMLNMSTAEYAATRSMVRAEVRERHYAATAAHEQVMVYSRTILPQARQSLQASTTAYQTGKTDFLMLLDGYRMYVELSTEALMARMQLERACAELERAVGHVPMALDTQEKGD